MRPWQTRWRALGHFLFGLSGEDSSPPFPPAQRWASPLPSHPQRLGRSERFKRQLGGVHLLPNSCPLRPPGATETGDGTKHKEVLLFHGREATSPTCPSPLLPNLSPLCCCCFVSKEFTKQEGRVRAASPKAGHCRSIGLRGTQRPPPPGGGGQMKASRALSAKTESPRT